LKFKQELATQDEYNTSPRNQVSHYQEQCTAQQKWNEEDYASSKAEIGQLKAAKDACEFSLIHLQQTNHRSESELVHWQQQARWSEHRLATFEEESQIKSTLLLRSEQQHAETVAHRDEVSKYAHDLWAMHTRLRERSTERREAVQQLRAQVQARDQHVERITQDNDALTHHLRAQEDMNKQMQCLFRHELIKFEETRGDLRQELRTARFGQPVLQQDSSVQTEAERLQSSNSSWSAPGVGMKGWKMPPPGYKRPPAWPAAWPAGPPPPQPALQKPAMPSSPLKQEV
jgi:hypothetical protein